MAILEFQSPLVAEPVASALLHAMLLCYALIPRYTPLLPRMRRTMGRRALRLVAHRPVPLLRQEPRFSSAAGKEFGVAVVGGSGYTGAELIRLLAGHPLARVPPASLLSAHAHAAISIGANSSPAALRPASPPARPSTNSTPRLTFLD